MTRTLHASQQRPATANANLITIGAYGTKPTVKKLASMHFTRAFCNSVVLPDGTVLTMGGQVGELRTP